MSATLVCLFNKFGHCKYKEICRQPHDNLKCEENECEISQCSKRHPKSCRYYDQFKRCKFGEFCSFLHRDKTEIAAPENEIKDMREKINNLENHVKAKESEMNDKITALENENRELKKGLGNVLQTMKKWIKTTVKEITEGFVSTISKLQDEKEKHRENQLHILTEQISTISSLLQPSSQMPVPRQPY